MDMDFRREKALRALFDARTIREAAQIAGVSESRMYAYTREEGFQARLREESSALLKITSKRLSEKAGSAVEVLCGAMEDESNPPQVRVAAADKILGHALKVSERVDLLTRIEELERAVTNDAGF